METTGNPETGRPASPPTPPPILYAPTVRTGRGWKYVALVLFLLLVLSSLSSLQSFFSSALGLESATAGPGERLQEVILESAGVPDKVAVVDLEGMIYGGYLSLGGQSPVTFVRQALKRAAADNRVRAVVLRIDSPGGEVLASDEISRAVREFQSESGKPVVAAMDGLAASGGYYVAAPCQWIVAHPMTITGSIGVIMQGYNYRGLMDKVGVRPEVFKSGRFKDTLRGSKAEEEIEPEERVMMQELIDATFARFKQVVGDGRATAQLRNQGRGRRLAEDWKEYADGRVMLGDQAFELGFVDELGPFETAVERAKELSRLKQANLIRYQRPFRLGGLFRLLGRTGATRLELDVGLRFPPIEVGRPYFLYHPGL